MNLGRTVFAQLISFLPDREFRRCVSRYDGDRRWRSFSCWDQFLSMAFAQLTYRESLRDIEACLRSLGAKLYHMGFCSQVARSTLADANESRDWRIYADFAQVLIRIARPLYVRDPIGVDLDQSLYALDSTTIDLCLSLFPWAKFRQRKAAVKMHTLLDLRGNIPTFIRITDGKVHDVNILDEIDPEPGAFYVMDRAYVDFERLFVFTLCSSFFVYVEQEHKLRLRKVQFDVQDDVLVVIGTTDKYFESPPRLARALSTVRIPYVEISKMEYEKSKHRRWKTGVLLTPLALLSKGKKHWFAVVRGEVIQAGGLPGEVGGRDGPQQDFDGTVRRTRTEVPKRRLAAQRLTDMGVRRKYGRIGG